ncbi:hypothetical protein C1H46_035349 [Malus baccata]|uniref:Glutamate--cysteine ligase n=1 Tax=Malus baccata TaxID=106549 RepID=A0A540KYK6_MALBA|nr:hypothetical protein C1H46_035349 [Malus baccata]
MALVSQTGSSSCIHFSSVPPYTARKTKISYAYNAGVGKMKPRPSVIVAASPSTEAAVIATEPRTKEDLIGHLASGCKPKEKWRIGTEQERFGFDLKTLSPMTYEHIAKLLNGIAERFDWEKIMEGDNIIALKQGKQSITLEPGGQFKHSGAPLETLHQICAEVNSHLYQLTSPYFSFYLVKEVLNEMGIGSMDIGCQPKWEVKDIPMMPKDRYEIIRNYMPKVGSLGLDLMFRTCTAQKFLTSSLDMIKKLRASLALQPIATALFANSPFTEGKPNGFLSMRSQMWTDTDNDRTGMIPFVFEDSFGFEQYVEYALDIPMYFVYRNKRHFDCTGMTFRDFMAGKLCCIPGALPNLNDWEMHLGTIYPEVRLKRYLDMRGADGGPWSRLRALPAFWVPKTGLMTPFRGRLLKHVAEDVVQFAKAGLERRGFNESGFLNDVVEVARTGVTPAEKLLQLYYKKWGQNIDPIFEELLS